MVKTGRCRIESGKIEYDKKMRCTSEKCEIFDSPGRNIFGWMRIYYMVMIVVIFK